MESSLSSPLPGNHIEGSSAPYPVPRIGSYNREMNNSGGGLDMGPVPAILTNKVPHLTIRCNQSAWTRLVGSRGKEQWVNMIGGQQMVGGVPAILEQEPPKIPPNNVDVKPTGIRAPVHGSRPSSTNSGPGSHQRWKKSKVFLATCGLGPKLSVKSKESDIKKVAFCMLMDFRAT